MKTSDLNFNKLLEGLDRALKNLINKGCDNENSRKFSLHFYKKYTFKVYSKIFKFVYKIHKNEENIEIITKFEDLVNLIPVIISLYNKDNLILQYIHDNEFTYFDKIEYNDEKFNFYKNNELISLTTLEINYLYNNNLDDNGEVLYYKSILGHMDGLCSLIYENINIFSKYTKLNNIDLYVQMLTKFGINIQDTTIVEFAEVTVGNLNDIFLIINRNNILYCILYKPNIILATEQNIAKSIVYINSVSEKYKNNDLFILLSYIMKELIEEYFKILQKGEK